MRRGLVDPLRNISMAVEPSDPERCVLFASVGVTITYDTICTTDIDTIKQ